MADLLEFEDIGAAHGLFAELDEEVLAFWFVVQKLVGQGAGGRGGGWGWGC